MIAPCAVTSGNSRSVKLQATGALDDNQQIEGQ